MMEAKHSHILAVLFFFLFHVQQGSADVLDNILKAFGGGTSTDDALLYTAIIILIVSVLTVIFLLVGLFLMYQAVKKKHEQLHPVPEEGDTWRGEVDDIIQGAHQMRPIPRATSMSARSQQHSGYDNQAIGIKERRSSDESNGEEDEPRRDYNRKQGGRRYGQKFPLNQ